jgi:hypothetical protein
MGGTLVLAGCFIALGRKKIGAPLLILEMLILIAVQDYPIVSGKMNMPKTYGLLYGDLTRHISVIGGALMLLATEMPEAEPVPEANKKKRD